MTKRSDFGPRRRNSAVAFGIRHWLAELAFGIGFRNSALASEFGTGFREALAGTDLLVQAGSVFEDATRMRRPAVDFERQVVLRCELAWYTRIPKVSTPESR
eukprot:654769-Rhodomonas_salina.2